MSETSEPSEQPFADPPEPPTFAARLNYLFDTVYPADQGRPYSSPEVAEAITKAGVKISDTYVWMLRKGQRDNPTKRHLQALAAFFGVPTAYFVDDERASAVMEQLELLAAARDAQVREIMLRSTELSEPDRSTVLRLIRRFTRDPKNREAVEDD